MLANTLSEKDTTAAGHGHSQALSDPFVFVPITGKEAAKGRGAAKRIVRAHVTRVQHSKSSTLSAFQNLHAWTVRPCIHRNALRNRRKQFNVDRQRVKSTNGHIEEAEEPEFNSNELAVALVPKLPTGTSLEDPFWTYPVEYQPYLSPIFAHYIQNVAVEIPDLDGPNERGLLRRSWFPLAMTEAATMYAVLLMAASHFCIVNPSKAVLIDLLALKARALSEINAALAKPNRAVTDAMIGAVAKMAAYEAVFGDSAIFSAHMKGLQMMLKLRGGLATLGLNGLLERMLVWIDLNAAHLTGTEVALGGESFPTQVAFSAPDPYHFAGIS